MKRSDLRQIAKATYEFDGQTMDFAFNEDAITPAFLKSVMDDEKNGDPEAVAKVVAEVVESWDLEDDAGQRLPADFEVARTLGIRHLMGVLDAIEEQIDGEIAEQGKDSGSS